MSGEIVFMIFIGSWIGAGALLHKIQTKKSWVITVGVSFFAACLIIGGASLLFPESQKQMNAGASNTSASINQNPRTAEYRQKLFEYLIQYYQSKNATLEKREEAHTSAAGDVYGPSASFSPIIFPKVKMQISVINSYQDSEVSIAAIDTIKMNLSPSDLNAVRNALVSMQIVGISNPETATKIKNMFMEKTQNLNENSFPAPPIDFSTDNVKISISTGQSGSDEYTMIYTFDIKVN